jgi:hypothetical protein
VGFNGTAETGCGKMQKFCLCFVAGTIFRRT